MASPGHRANILDPRFTHGGVGLPPPTARCSGATSRTRACTPSSSCRHPAPLRPRPAPPSGGGGRRWRRWRRRPSAPVAAAPRPKPQAEAATSDDDAPSRPESSAGIDGVTVVVAAPRARRTAALSCRADELAAARATALVVNRPVAVQTATATMACGPNGGLGPARGGAGICSTALVGALLGFLFG